jgi:hypothetical protein
MTLADVVTPGQVAKTIVIGIVAARQFLGVVVDQVFSDFSC